MSPLWTWFILCWAFGLVCWQMILNIMSSPPATLTKSKTRDLPAFIQGRDETIQVSSRWLDWVTTSTSSLVQLSQDQNETGLAFHYQEPIVCSLKQLTTTKTFTVLPLTTNALTLSVLSILPNSGGQVTVTQKPNTDLFDSSDLFFNTLWTASSSVNKPFALGPGLSWSQPNKLEPFQLHVESNQVIWFSNDNTSFEATIQPDQAVATVSYEYRKSNPFLDSYPLILTHYQGEIDFGFNVGSNRDQRSAFYSPHGIVVPNASNVLEFYNEARFGYGWKLSDTPKLTTSYDQVARAVWSSSGEGYLSVITSNGFYINNQLEPFDRTANIFQSMSNISQPLLLANQKIVVPAYQIQTGRGILAIFDPSQLSSGPTILGHEEGTGINAYFFSALSIINQDYVELCSDGLKTIVVGIPYYGVVMTYQQSDDTYLASSQVLADVNSAQFGQSLSMTTDGLQLVVGAPGDNNNAGSIWFYQRVNMSSSWNLVDGPVTRVGGIQYGQQVKVASTTTLAVLDNSVVEIWHSIRGSATNWTLTATITPSVGPTSIAWVGHGRLLAIGSTKAEGRGQVWLYQWTSQNTWTRIQTLSPPTSSSLIQFGMDLYMLRNGMSLLVTAANSAATNTFLLY